MIGDYLMITLPSTINYGTFKVVSLDHPAQPLTISNSSNNFTISSLFLDEASLHATLNLQLQNLKNPSVCYPSNSLIVNLYAVNQNLV